MRFDKIKIKGKIWVQTVADGSTERHRGSIDEGRLIYSTADEKLYFGTDTEWLEFASRYDVFTAGTKLLMGYNPLPDNWAINSSSSINDRIVLLTNDASEIGDLTSDSWTITGMQSSESHDHGGSTNISSSYYSIGNSDFKGDYIPLYNHVHTITADGIHTHTFDGTWRPAHIKLVEAEYS